MVMDNPCVTLSAWNTDHDSWIRLNKTFILCTTSTHLMLQSLPAHHHRCFGSFQRFLIYCDNDGHFIVLTKTPSMMSKSIINTALPKTLELRNASDFFLHHIFFFLLVPNIEIFSVQLSDVHH